MNLVLETFERVLYPSGGAATRRASTSAVPHHYHRSGGAGSPIAHHSLAVNRQQTMAIVRRRSGGINAPSQLGTGRSGRGSPLLMSASNSYATTIDPPRGTERALVLHRRESPNSNGGTSARRCPSPQAIGGAEPGGGGGGGSGTSSRSRSGGARRKKSGGAHPRKQSVASLLFAAISASAPTNQHKRKSRQPPPRQWSVPERGPDEEEPFQLVRKTPSMALPLASSSASSCYSQQRTPLQKQQSGEELLVESPQQQHSAGIVPPDGPPQSILLGFVSSSLGTSPRASFCFGRKASDHQSAESPCLAQCGRIRQWPALNRALLLRCVDPEPTYPYLHYAVFEGSGQSIEVAEEMNRSGTGQTEFASFEEVIALERQSGSVLPSSHVGSASSAVPRPASLHPPPSSAHHGFIVLSFRLLDDQADGASAQLESTWLSWTGAHEIYKYSPREWLLRRLSLHRRVVPSSPYTDHDHPSLFGYVLLCEFGAILHPANALAALDMCERLRARNCGMVSLYQVRHCYGAGSPAAFPSPSSSSFSVFGSPPPVPNSLSPHWSPNQIRRGAHRLARMGHSQDVPNSNGMVAGQRRTMMLRMRERSLGWDGNGNNGNGIGGGGHGTAL